MSEGFIVGILLFSILVYGMATDFDDGQDN